MLNSCIKSKALCEIKNDPIEYVKTSFHQGHMFEAILEILRKV